MTTTKIVSGAIVAVLLSACGQATPVPLPPQASPTPGSQTPAAWPSPSPSVPTGAHGTLTELPPGLYVQYSVAHTAARDASLKDVLLASVPQRQELPAIEGVLAGAVSPDGKHALSLQPDGLRLHHLATVESALFPLAIEGAPLEPSECDTPKWSPSSRLAAFACQPLRPDPEPGPALFVFTVASQRLIALPVPLQCFSPSWSPQEDALAADCWDEFSGGIRIIPVNGEPFFTFVCPEPLICNRPAWSPDGLFLSFFAGEGRSGSPAVPFGPYIAPGSCVRDASGCVNGLVGPIAPAEDWDWSPNATRIAYVERGDVWVYDFATGVSSQVDHSLNPIIAVKWSPDGQWLALAHFDSIMILSLAGLPTQYLLGPSIELQDWVLVTGSP